MLQLGARLSWQDGGRDLILAQWRFTLVLGFSAGEGLIPNTKPLTGWMVAFLLFAAVLLVDVLSPPEVEYSAFYLIPVIWLAWSQGTREGLSMALIAGAGWYVHDLLSGRALSSEYFRLWDALNQQISYLLAAWVVGTLRREATRQRALVEQLNASMAEVRELKGLLPVCAWCHNIRDDEGQWHTMEVFLSSRTKASMTHGICPTCEAKLHQEAGSR
jgi:hypothetical protein